MAKNPAFEKLIKFFFNELGQTIFIFIFHLAIEREQIFLDKPVKKSVLRTVPPILGGVAKGMGMDKDHSLRWGANSVPTMTCPAGTCPLLSHKWVNEPFSKNSLFSPSQERWPSHKVFCT